jgi:hypothetical protein
MEKDVQVGGADEVRDHECPCLQDVPRAVKQCESVSPLQGLNRHPALSRQPIRQRMSRTRVFLWRSTQTYTFPLREQSMSILCRAGEPPRTRRIEPAHAVDGAGAEALHSPHAYDGHHVSPSSRRRENLCRRAARVRWSPKDDDAPSSLSVSATVAVVPLSYTHAIDHVISFTPSPIFFFGCAPSKLAIRPDRSYTCVGKKKDRSYTIFMSIPHFFPIMSMFYIQVNRNVW